MRKIMTMIFEFDLGDRKSHLARLNAGYEAAASAAITAVENELLEGGLADVRTSMYYDYRQFSSTRKQTEFGDAGMDIDDGATVDEEDE
jgi:hypothetical protein